MTSYDFFSQQRSIQCSFASEWMYALACVCVYEIVFLLNFPSSSSLHFHLNFGLFTANSHWQQHLSAHRTNDIRRNHLYLFIHNLIACGTQVCYVVLRLKFDFIIIWFRQAEAASKYEQTHMRTKNADRLKAKKRERERKGKRKRRGQLNAKKNEVKESFIVMSYDRSVYCYSIYLSVCLRGVMVIIRRSSLYACLGRISCFTLSLVCCPTYFIIEYYSFFVIVVRLSVCLFVCLCNEKSCANRQHSAKLANSYHIRSVATLRVMCRYYLFLLCCCCYCCCCCRTLI